MQQNIECPFCGHITQHGYTVCAGCQSRIVYGASDGDLWWPGVASGLLWLFVSVIAYPIYTWLLSSIVSNPVYGTFLVFGIWIVSYLIGRTVGRSREEEKLQGKPRFIRRVSY